jgi:adenosine/AMP kinase
VVNMRPEEGHQAMIFVDTGANINTKNRLFLQIQNNGQICNLTEGPVERIVTQCDGGSKVIMLVEVETNMGCITATLTFIEFG